MSAVERVARPTYERFARDFLRAGVPVVITGMMDGWPAMRRWSFDYLRRVFGARSLSPVVLASGQFHLGTGGVQFETMDFGRYVDALAAAPAPPLYLRHPLTADDAALEADFETPAFCRRRLMLKRNLWVGGQGTASDLHYDMTHNVVGQVTGHRRVVLFRREETEYVYPFPRRTLKWHHSQVRLEAVDLQRFPLFARARPLETELMGGEMLFIPPGVWHRFETLAPSIAVNFLWLTPQRLPAMAAAQVLWSVRGRKT